MSAVLKEQSEPGYNFLFKGLDTFFHTINVGFFYKKMYYRLVYKCFVNDFNTVIINIKTPPPPSKKPTNILIMVSPV